MIKSIQPNELEILSRLGPEFYQEANLPGRFVPEVFVHRWGQIIASGVGRIFAFFIDGTPIGAIGIIISNDINDDARVAQEAFWFVEKSHRKVGLKLFHHAENYARNSGCKRMAMIHLVNLQPEKLGALYERMGYSLVEHSYHKTF